MKIVLFWFKFHWKMFPRFQLTNIQHYPKAINRGQAIIWTNDGLVHWHIYVLLSLDEFKTLKPRQNGRHFPDNIFQCIFLNENVWILIKISLKFVPKLRIKNIPALVQIMDWRRPGDKPLSEPMRVRLPTHICVTQPQWVNHYCNIRHWSWVSNSDILVAQKLAQNNFYLIFILSYTCHQVQQY